MLSKREVLKELVDACLQVHIVRTNRAIARCMKRRKTKKNCLLFQSELLKHTAKEPPNKTRLPMAGSPGNINVPVGTVNAPVPAPVPVPVPVPIPVPVPPTPHPVPPIPDGRRPVPPIPEERTQIPRTVSPIHEERTRVPTHDWVPVPEWGYPGARPTQRRLFGTPPAPHPTPRSRPAPGTGEYPPIPTTGARSLQGQSGSPPRASSEVSAQRLQELGVQLSPNSLPPSEQKEAEPQHRELSPKRSEQKEEGSPARPHRPLTPHPRDQNVIDLSSPASFGIRHRAGSEQGRFMHQGPLDRAAAATAQYSKPPTDPPEDPTRATPQTTGQDPWSEYLYFWTWSPCWNMDPPHRVQSTEKTPKTKLGPA